MCFAFFERNVGVETPTYTYLTVFIKRGVVFFIPAGNPGSCLKMQNSTDGFKTLKTLTVVAFEYCLKNRGAGVP